MIEPNICIFGCKQTTAFLVGELVKVTRLASVITISPHVGAAAQVADYYDMNLICSEENIPCYVANRYSLNDPEDCEAIANIKPDIGLVIGWQRLIPASILNIFSVGVFGMHGSADDLPRGRGRSPMNWALIERRSHFYTNLFKYDAGVDSGDILDSFVFSIRSTDTAETMHFKNVLAMKHLVLKNLDEMKSGNIKLRKQQHCIPTFYPKRNPEDSIIDWRRDVFEIDAHIRAVTRPFNGAFTFCNQERLTIYRAAIFETDIVDYGYSDNLIGEVVEIFTTGKFLVRCRGGILIIHEYDTTTDIKKSDLLESPEELIRQFPVNAFGNHDVEEA